MDKIRVFVNLFLILIVIILLIGVFLVKQTNNQITAKVIDSQENNGIDGTIQQIKEGLRFSRANIIYIISQDCSKISTQKMIAAFSILENYTKIKFIEQENPDLTIDCFSVAFSEDLTKLSEGGPTLIAGKEILEAKIILYDSENNAGCSVPMIELHELFHALGFIHTTKKGSIMYPIFSCDKTLDSEIFDILNEEYD